ncbi:MAG: hypothetical protein K0V04_00455 [Deltaproteobacteria bacterium]|nr:hypothetical protein [Deltaproteobacteria bacterium]
MRWLLRDGPQQLVLSTERGAPFEGAVMVEDSTAAASALRHLAYNAENMKTIRQIHADMTDSHNSRSRADTLVLAEIMSLVATRRMYMFEQSRTVVLNYQVPEAADDEGWDDEGEVVYAAPPPPPPEPVATPAMIAQAAALRQAAESGAPFCEE